MQKREIWFPDSQNHWVSNYFVYLLKYYSIIAKYEGNETKPVPRRLQLRPEHVSFLGGTIKFTPARFNITSSNDEEEASIVTSTGPYVITWNFRRVKQGKLYDYTIKQYHETIVADNFRLTIF